MRVAIVENTAFTHHGQVGVALHQAAARIGLYKPWSDGRLSDPDGYEALVVFGGEQAATDDHTHPYLPALAACIRAFESADKAVLGICLGAQLMARAFGGVNRLGATREAGWCEVALRAEGRADPLFHGIADRFRIMQLHSDTFDLPPGAVHLATSPVAPAQAFRIGRASYAAQFHFEASRAVVADWNRGFAHVFRATDPDWDNIYPQALATHGAAADATGLQLARNWVGLIRG